MRRTFSVTVVTEIDFVGSPSDDDVQSHLERLVESLKGAAEVVSTRVTASVRVPFCGGAVVTAARNTGAVTGRPARRGGRALVMKSRHATTGSRRPPGCGTAGGIVRPRALAVRRLMTSSNFVGCSTGRSAGLAPSRIRSA